MLVVPGGNQNPSSFWQLELSESMWIGGSNKKPIVQGQKVTIVRYAGSVLVENCSVRYAARSSAHQLAAGISVVFQFVVVSKWVKRRGRGMLGNTLKIWRHFRVTRNWVVESVVNGGRIHVLKVGPRSKSA